MHRTLTWIPLALFAACSSDAGATASSDILRRPPGLEGVELVTAADNPLTAAKAELGKQLFFDPRLSGSGTMACAACHLPEKAFTDGKALSVRDDGKANTRNSPTMHNVGYLERLYWDGRAQGLEANVLAAWKAQIAGKPEEAAARLQTVEAYRKSFQAAFGTGPSETTIVQALASFLRTLRSGDSAYDRWLAGGKKDGLGEAATRGYDLFMGKAGCVVCHTPPLFTNRQFHNVGVGMQAESPDVGAAAANALNDPAKTGAFKTPTLRDVARTAPYFHDGSVATLREAVQRMASGGLANPHKDPLLVDRGLSDAEIDQLVAFLETLTGSQPWAPPVVPQ
ncbi:MAG: c-type cytochrome [Planctomycetes bacterium]|nr:c-type cytochrome [Planctomycetota bacterium]